MTKKFFVVSNKRVISKTYSIEFKSEAYRCPEAEECTIILPSETAIIKYRKGITEKIRINCHVSKLKVLLTQNGLSKRDTNYFVSKVSSINPTGVCTVTFIVANSTIMDTRIWIENPYYKDWMLWETMDVIENYGKTAYKGSALYRLRYTGQHNYYTGMFKKLNDYFLAITHPLGVLLFKRGVVIKDNGEWDLLARYTGVLLDNDYNKIDKYITEGLPEGINATTGLKFDSIELPACLPDYLAYYIQGYFESTPNVRDYYFPLYSIDDIDKVSKDTNLPIPYDNITFKHGFISVRITHYYNTDNNLVPVVFGSLTVVNNICTSFKLLLFKRPREYGAKLPTPEPVLKLADYIDEHPDFTPLKDL